MKTRTGFVSNSSSTSFLVAFDQIPEDIYEVHKTLFKDREYIYSTSCNGGSVDTFDAARSILQAIENQKDKLPLSREFIGQQFFDVLHGEAYAQLEDKYDHVFRIEDKEERIKVQREQMKETDELYEKLLTEMMEELETKYKGKVLLHFEYEDHSQWEATMERGDVFQALPHEKISLH